MTDRGNLLKGARVYLSGPMDFVASRSEEKRSGWRTRVRQFLKQFEAIVYDPWATPIIIGPDGYGKDYEYAGKKRAEWTFEDSESGRRTRSELCELFHPTVKINCRTVDICDFLIAYCPTNIYSVGTVNEIVRARQQHKPVLFVSPPVIFPALQELTKHLETKGDKEGLAFLDQLKSEAALKPNPDGVPSPWYLGLLPEDYLFDGFGFSLYPDLKDQHKFSQTFLDEIEELKPPKRALLPYLAKLNKEIPKRYDLAHNKLVENSDWLILQPGVHEHEPV
jgi:hypothetical protein